MFVYFVLWVFWVCSFLFYVGKDPSSPSSISLIHASTVWRPLWDLKVESLDWFRLDRRVKVYEAIYCLTICVEGTTIGHQLHRCQPNGRNESLKDYLDRLRTALVRVENPDQHLIFMVFSKDLLVVPNGRQWFCLHRSDVEQLQTLPGGASVDL